MLYNRLFVFGPMLMLAVFIGGCASTASLPEPIAQDDPMPTGTLAEVDLLPDYLQQLDADLAGIDDHQLDSILVARHGRLVYERYFNGYAADTPHDLRSATKSITSLLVGMAIDDGAILNVDQPMMSHLRDAYPEVDDKGDIQLRHLLTMASGLDCSDRDPDSRGQEDRMYRQRDWVGYFLSLETVAPPGLQPDYCTGGVVALGRVISEATGQQVDAYAQQKLFAPLGIRNLRWARFDDDSQIDTGGHLLLTPRALVKIGQLVLQQGQWQGESLLSPAWINEATTPQVTLDNTPYGYLWWLHEVDYGVQPVRIIAARGNGGQTLFIAPQFDLVAVTTASYYNDPQAAVVDRIFFNAILPSVPELQAAAQRTAPTGIE
ncbi:serine hydrolase domain-containing protein [Saccharospirillum mangrovi]|uniref:serine hydrolase domain-containing protein n=1 Tax=Saccharospirillum mangrovi TaxID=2161747 RepID=UPI000D36AAB2|nr:serine hydrolase [Saccharospirillum mangrovi]